jgi:hypothetical protein
MAKRTTPRSSDGPASPAAPGQQAPNRARRSRGQAPDGGGTASAGDTRSAGAGANAPPAEAADMPSAAAVASQVPAADPRTSVSMGSEPSEEDIRLRAYHMFLERGGNHGADFDDWLRAEQELRQRG